MFSYEAISDFFDNHLKVDMKKLESKDFNDISLAVKWCPSLDSSFVKSTLLCDNIARKFSLNNCILNMKVWRMHIMRTMYVTGIWGRASRIPFDIIV